MLQAPLKRASLQQKIINTALLILLLVTLSPTKVSLASAQSPATLPVVNKNYVAG